MSRRVDLATYPPTLNDQDLYDFTITPQPFAKHLEFENYYGISWKAAWHQLSYQIHPLDCYQFESKLMTSPPVQRVSEENRLTQAFYTATALMTKLGVQNVVDHKLSGTFLTNDSPSSDIPLVFDTGCRFSVTPCIDDFSSPPEPLTTSHSVLDFKDNRTQVASIGWVHWTI